MAGNDNQYTEYDGAGYPQEPGGLFQSVSPGALIAVGCGLLIVLIGLIGAAAAGWFFITQRQEAAQAEQEQMTAEAQAVVAQQTQAALAHPPEPPDGWTEMLRYDFEAYSQDWHLGEYGTEYGNVEKFITEGVYRWQSEVNSSAIWWSSLDATEELTDFHAEVSVRQTDGDRDQTGFGIVFHQTDDGQQYYYFAVSEYGDYSIYMFRDDEWASLVDWTSHPAITRGETNVLAVRAEGKEYSFFINDQYITHIDNSALSSGAIGLAMEVYEPGFTSVIEFDDFVLYTP